MEMGVTAEVVAKRYKISREAQDEYALASQQRTACCAQQEGFFAGEIAPMKVTMAILDKKTGEKTGTQEVSCDRDECNRPGYDAGGPGFAETLLRSDQRPRDRDGRELVSTF